MLFFLDAGQILNLSMFEQNGNCGYVHKPNIYWDKEHPQYGHFNPSIIEREGPCFELTITVNFNLKKNFFKLKNKYLGYFWSIFNTKCKFNNKCLY